MKKLFMAIMSLIVLGLAAGCGSDAGKAEEKKQGITLNYPAVLQKYGFTEPLVLEKMPQRVVSLAHTPVLALYEMGITQVAVPENKMFAWPEELAKNAKQLNTAMNDNFDIESVIALQPDLVIVGYNAKDTYGKILEKERIPVYYVDAGHVVTYQSVKELTEILINAFGDGNEGAQQIRERFAQLEARMQEKRSANSGKQVMVLQSAPPRHFIQTKDGTVGSMAELLGYQNVYSNDSSKLVMLDKEQSLSYEPDLILSVGAAATAQEQQLLMEEDFAAHADYWNSFKAVREDKIVYLPVSYIASGGIHVIDQINALIDMLKEAEAAGKNKA